MIQTSDYTTLFYVGVISVRAPIPILVYLIFVGKNTPDTNDFSLRQDHAWLVGSRIDNNNRSGNDTVYNMEARGPFY